MDVNPRVCPIAPESTSPAARKVRENQNSAGVDRRCAPIDADAIAKRSHGVISAKLTVPDDAAVLQQMLRTLLLEHGELHAENDKLRLLVQRLTRHRSRRWPNRYYSSSFRGQRRLLASSLHATARRATSACSTKSPQAIARRNTNSAGIACPRTTMSRKVRRSWASTTSLSGSATLSRSRGRRSCGDCDPKSINHGLPSAF